jgi:hypothetical protein
MNQHAAFDETVNIAYKSDMPEGDLDNPLSLAHLLDMQERITPEFSDAKLGRWLGWAQAALVAANVGVTLDDVKQINLRHSDVTP